MNLTELRARLAVITDEQRAMHEAAGEAAFTPEQNTAWDTLQAERSEVERKIGEGEAEERKAAERLEQRQALAARALAAPGAMVIGDGARNAPAVIIKADPFAVLEDRSVGGQARVTAVRDANLRAIEGRDLGGADNEKHFERLLARHGSDLGWAENILSRSKPAYSSGFAKYMNGTQHFMSDEERAAATVGTATAGGLLVPTHLDPTLMITNAGTSNNIRGISKVVTLTTGNTWNGATTAGVTASWDGEVTEVSDDTPAFAAAQIPTFMAQALVQASVLAMEDIAGLTSDILMLFADAKDRLEGAAHATGNGTTAPQGIFTAVNGSASLQVTSASAAAIALVDLHSLYRTLPVRWRGKGTFLMNPLYSLAIKALGTALSASYSTDITQGTAGSLLGRPVVESDDAPTTQTTTALDNEVIFGDFSGYTIVDMPGGFSVEYIPHLFNTTTNLPDGRRAWYARWRNGAKAVNLASFRMLVDKTSA